MRLIDADTLIKYMCDHCGVSCNLEDACCSNVDAVGNIPTVDAVPVVRCKDCKYSEDLDENIARIYIDGCMHCAHHRGDSLNVVSPDEYCSEGEREGETN